MVKIRIQNLIINLLPSAIEKLLIQWSVLVKGKFQHQAIIILALRNFVEGFRWLEINRYLVYTSLDLFRELGGIIYNKLEK